MLRTQTKAEARRKQLVTAGGVAGASVAALLVGVSLLLFSLRKTRVKVELKKGS